MTTWQRLGHLDKRYFYVLIALAVIVPMVRPLGLPVPTSDMVKRVYNLVDSLPNGALVLMSFDYDAGNEVDLHPQAETLLRHLASKNAKVVAMGSSHVGTGFAERKLPVLEEFGYQYGDDYVILGYLAGQEPSLAAFAQSPNTFFTTDYRNNPTSSMGVTKNLSSLSDFDLVISLNAGTPIGLREEHWVRVASGAYNRDLVIGCIGMIEAIIMPYVDSGQCKGVLGGVNAAAQYEQLEGTLGAATIAMDQQSMAHALVFGLVILGNVVEIGVRKGRTIGKGDE